MTLQTSMKYDEEQSEIQNFYKGSNIFITGGSGFLGHLLLQKLIRDCPDVSKIYLLIRIKKEKTPKERLDEMLQNVVFERMKTERPNYAEKIVLITGDLEKSGLGLNEDDRILLSKEVNIIFHLAATVSFHEKMKKAASINIRATRDVVNLAKTMTGLKAFIHCSTAYSNCARKEIDEVFYDMPCSADRLLNMTNILSDDELEVLTPNLIGDWPNTYAFTKGIAENVIMEEGYGLPIAVVRPSMITSTVDDPLEGWINNIYGPVGLMAGVGLGIIRVFLANEKFVADIIPGDYVIHNMIAAAFYVGTTSNKVDHNDNNTRVQDGIKLSNKMPIFNSISGEENPITWKTVNDYGRKMLKWETTQAIWYYVFMLQENLYLARFLQALLHTVPAYLIDFALLLTGKKQRMMKLYGKIHYFGGLLEYFSTREWDFENNNCQELWKYLNNTDKKLFPFSVKDLDWETYFVEKYGKGIRLYIYKDPLETLPHALQRYQKLKYLHYTLVYGFYIFCAFIFFKIFSMFI